MLFGENWCWSLLGPKGLRGLNKPREIRSLSNHGNNGGENFSCRVNCDVSKLIALIPTNRFCQMFPFFLESNLNWLPAVSHKKRFCFGQIINPLQIKLIRSRWLIISLALFSLALYGPRRKNTQKRKWPTSSHLVTEQAWSIKHNFLKVSVLLWWTLSQYITEGVYSANWKHTNYM